MKSPFSPQLAAVLCLGICRPPRKSSRVMDTVVTGQQGSGCIDWTARIIYSRGNRRPEPMRDGGRPQARRNTGCPAGSPSETAWKTLKGIYLNSSTTVENS